MTWLFDTFNKIRIDWVEVLKGVLVTPNSCHFDMLHYKQSASIETKKKEEKVCFNSLPTYSYNHSHRLDQASSLLP